MRVQVDGVLTTETAIRALRVSVLPYVAPVPASAKTKPTALPTSIRLQGTIESADAQKGVYIVHVSDHERTVRADDLTLFQTDQGGDLAPDSLHSGDRVRVAGTLLPNGMVDAAAMTLVVGLPPATNTPSPRPSPVVQLPNAADLAQVISGSVTSRASFFSRDIKIRVQDREIKVSVPRGIPIMRGDRGISIHDLGNDAQVTIHGQYTGQDSFQASQIDVSGQYVPDPPRLSKREAGRVPTTLGRRSFYQALTSSRMPDSDPVSRRLSAVTTFRQAQPGDQRVCFCQVVDGRIAEQFTGIGDVQPFKAIIAQTVENPEPDVLRVDTALDELLEIAMRDETVEHCNSIFLARGFQRLKRSDPYRDHAQPLLLRHVAAERLAEAFRHAVEVAGVHRVARLHLNVFRIARNGVNRRCEDEAAAPGRFRGDKRMVRADDIIFEQLRPNRRGAGAGGEMKNCVDPGESLLQLFKVREGDFDDFATTLYFRCLLAWQDSKPEVILFPCVAREKTADVAGRPGDGDFATDFAPVDGERAGVC